MNRKRDKNTPKTGGTRDSIQRRIDAARGGPPPENKKQATPSPADKDDEERFLRQMEERLAADKPDQRPTRQPPAAQAQPATPSENWRQRPKRKTDSGSMLLLANRRPAIVLRPLPRQGRHELLLLEDDGSLTRKAVESGSLETLQQIGHMDAAHLEEMAESLEWDRDLIVFHLSQLRFNELIPQPPQAGGEPPDAQAPPPPEAAPQSDYDRLVRGQRFKIVYDANREWTGIYWGETDQGPAVAHQNKDDWFLVPMDLARYRDKIVALEVLSTEERDAIATKIVRYQP